MSTGACLAGALGAVLLGCAPPAWAEPIVHFDVFVDAAATARDASAPNQLTAATSWLGVPTQAALHDDGVAPDLRADDGTWSGRLSGPPVRFLRVTVDGTLGPGRRPIRSDTVERVLAPADALYLSVHAVGENTSLQRLSGPGDMLARQQVERQWLYAALAWAVFNGFVAVALARHARVGAPRTGAR